MPPRGRVTADLARQEPGSSSPEEIQQTPQEFGLGSPAVNHRGTVDSAAGFARRSWKKLRVGCVWRFLTVWPLGLIRTRKRTGLCFSTTRCQQWAGQEVAPRQDLPVCVERGPLSDLEIPGFGESPLLMSGDVVI